MIKFTEEEEKLILKHKKLFEKFNRFVYNKKRREYYDKEESKLKRKEWQRRYNNKPESKLKRKEREKRKGGYNKAERNKFYYQTKKILKKIYTNPTCKICYSQKDLETHHEIYPKTIEEIYDLINSGKIYYLCRRHHYQLRKTYN